MLSKKKYKIGPEVKFDGYFINGEGTRQDQKFIKGIMDFPALYRSPVVGTLGRGTGDWRPAFYK